MIGIGLLLAGTVVLVEGIASELRGRKTKAKILIIGGIFAMMVAAGMIHEAVVSGLSR